ncbi:MAG: hypothetical protein JWR07_2608, partial [Nevskia sp.]|nr:hypothetical protein [Nevskia sp.]
MRLSRPFFGFVFAACGGAAHALSIDGELQLHAAVGQPLSVSVPITLAGDEVSRIYYRLTPASGLAEAEERVAAQVHAAYDPAVPAIVLSTSTRVTVPAMRLHLEVGAGSVVVSRDLTVLFDIPDLNKSSPLEFPTPVVGQVVARPDNAARPAATPAAASTAVPDGAHAISIGKEEDQKTAIAYGDAAAGGGAVTGAAAVQTVIAPRPKYFNSYQVKKGDTLASIAAHFARAGAGNADAVMLAVFEANIDDFAAGNPQHPTVGRQLDIPDAASIGSEPGYRIAEFKDYLRKPVGEWQVPVTLLRKAAEPAPEAPRETPGWQQPRNLIGAAALLLVLWGLRTLFAGGKHKRAMAARRAVATGGVPAMQPNLPQAAPVAPTPREPARLLTAAAPETEQAEISRLRELLTQQPGRADIRLRLAQRLFEARRAAGFAEVALPLEAVLSPEAWERVRA